MMKQERTALKKQDKDKDIIRINKIQEYQKQVDFKQSLRKIIMQKNLSNYNKIYQKTKV